jgi:hypothetical protein
MREQEQAEWPAMSCGTAIVEWQSIRARRDAGDDLVLMRIEPPVAALTPESYTVRKLAEDFLTGQIGRHRDFRCAPHFRRRIMTRIAAIAGSPAASVTRKRAIDACVTQR